MYHEVKRGREREKGIRVCVLMTSLSHKMAAVPRMKNIASYLQLRVGFLHNLERVYSKCTNTSRLFRGCAITQIARQPDSQLEEEEEEGEARFPMMYENYESFRPISWSLCNILRSFCT